MQSAARGIVIAASFIAATPFAIGIFRIAGRMGLTLARSAWPRSPPQESFC